jgi:hypothetical protein
MKILIKHPYVTGLLAGIFFTLLFLNVYFLHLFEIPDPTHWDLYVQALVVKHIVTTIQTGHWHEFATLPMFYGSRNSLFFNDLSPLPNLAVPFIYFVTRNIMATTNIQTVMLVYLNFICMFFLSFKILKKIFPSLLAGIIFSFNPFIFTHFPDHFTTLAMFWVPLSFLSVEVFVRHPTRKNSFLIFFVLFLQLVTSLYYFVFLTVVLPLYLGLRLWQEKVPVKSLINTWALIGILLLAVTGIGTKYMYNRAYYRAPLVRDTNYIDSIYTAWPADYLFSPPDNLIYGNFRQIASDTFPYLVRPPNHNVYDNLKERDLFWGITPFILFVLSFFFLPKSSSRKTWFTCTCFLVFCLFLSFGPHIYLSYNFRLPNIYIPIFHLNPLLSLTRATARFAGFVFLFLGLIVGLVVRKIGGKTAKSALILLAVTFLIILEYWNKPVRYYSVNSDTLNFYKNLSGAQNIKSIVNLPIGMVIEISNRLIATRSVDPMYILEAAVYHNKNIVNGYAGYIPPDYGQKILILNNGFPSPEKIVQLRKWKIDAVVLHKDLFQYPQIYEDIRSHLKNLGIPEIAQTDTLSLFDISKL